MLLVTVFNASLEAPKHCIENTGCRKPSTNHCTNDMNDVLCIRVEVNLISSTIHGKNGEHDALN